MVAVTSTEIWWHGGGSTSVKGEAGEGEPPQEEKRLAIVRWRVDTRRGTDKSENGARVTQMVIFRAHSACVILHALTIEIKPYFFLSYDTFANETRHPSASLFSPHHLQGGQAQTTTLPNPHRLRLPRTT